MSQKDSNSRNCTEPELVYLFPLYLNGDGSPGERKRIVDHLAQCAVCREDMKFFSKLQRIGREEFEKEQPNDIS